MSKFFRTLVVAILAFTFASTSQAGLLDALLPRPSTIIGAVAIGAVIQASKNCKTAKDLDTGRSQITCKKQNIAASESGNEEDKPSLLDEKGRKHILEGDGPKAGGGHRSGTGKPGKSEFPADWSDEKIEGEISDIATDPATEWTEPDVRGYIETSSIRDGVEIKVVFNTKLGRVVTAYPLNRERNE